MAYFNDVAKIMASEDVASSLSIVAVALGNLEHLFAKERWRADFNRSSTFTYRSARRMSGSNSLASVKLNRIVSPEGRIFRRE
jgi:hypothetical protein